MTKPITEVADHHRSRPLSDSAETAAPVPVARKPAPNPPSATDDRLASLLAEHRVPWETLNARYKPLLELTRIVIGMVPNCDRYLEIWEPAFRTYNIMVPNFFNVPFSVFGDRRPRRVSARAMPSRSAPRPIEPGRHWRRSPTAIDANAARR